MRLLTIYGAVLVILNAFLLTWSAPSSNGKRSYTDTLVTRLAKYELTAAHLSHQPNATALAAVQPSHSARPPRHSRPTREQRNTRKALSIGLSVVVAVIGVGFFVAIVRNLVRSQRAPKRDHLAEETQRRDLEREMGHLEDNNLGPQQWSPPVPAPPYMPRPPSYQDSLSPPANAPNDVTVDHTHLPACPAPAVLR